MALLVTAVMLSTPSTIFAQSVSLVDTELRERGTEPQRVLTKMELGDAASLESVSEELGAWRMTTEHDWDKVADILNTDVLLSRDYSHPNLIQPAHLLIIQSYNVSSFHPAPVCYRVQGWELPADGGRSVPVAVPNATWAESHWLSEAEPRAFNGTIEAKLFDVVKRDDDGNVTEKRVALYVYIKREDWRVTNSVTWVRTEIAVTPDTTAEQAAPVLADLLGAALPELFHFGDEDEDTLGFSLLTGGVPGIAAFAAMLALPAALGFPLLKGPLMAWLRPPPPRP